MADSTHIADTYVMPDRRLKILLIVEEFFPTTTRVPVT
jgi:hypothetical protein